MPSPPDSDSATDPFSSGNRRLVGDQNQDRQRGHLPRLPQGAYQGKAIVHWTMTLQDRTQGWLTSDFHRAFRWGLLHGCARYAVACPVYCLMPDHVHLLGHGWEPRADQLRFIRFLRRFTGPWLKTGDAEHSVLSWQKQAYDHVLRPEERDRYAFEALVHYILENPVRAGLVKTHFEWPYSAGVVPGYPELKIGLPDYWVRYWRIVKARSLDA